MRALWENATGVVLKPLQDFEMLIRKSVQV